MNILRLFEVISWFSLPTVMFGGFSLLRLLTKGRTLTPFQVTCFRAGHAHAGVLLLMSLLYYRYLAETTYAERTTLILCSMLVIGILAQSGGFFLHMLLGREGERSLGHVSDVLRRSSSRPCDAFSRLWPRGVSRVVVNCERST